MTSMEERLREKLNAKLGGIKKNEIETITDVEILDKKDLKQNLENIFENIDFSYIDKICEDEDNDTKDFLKKQTLNILVQDGLSKLKLGEILEEVYKEIGNKKNGLYLKWLEGTDINPRTALRYRNRYVLFKKIKKEPSQQVVLKLSNENIEKILESDSTTEKVVNILENGGDQNTVKEFLNKLVTIEFKEEPEPIKYDYNSFNKSAEYITTKVRNNWENIEEKKKKKIGRLFQKIEEILTK